MYSEASLYVFHQKVIIPGFSANSVSCMPRQQQRVIQQMQEITVSKSGSNLFLTENHQLTNQRKLNSHKYLTSVHINAFTVYLLDLLDQH